MKIRLGYPLRLALLYILLGGLWILFTDRLVAALFTDPHMLLMSNTYKGWFFILITALLLFLELIREARMRTRDQATLQASQEKFKYFFDNSVDGKSITQLTGGLQVNQAFCEMLGYSRPELEQRTWQAITHPEDVDTSQKAFDALLSGEKEVVRFTKRYIHKNGSTVWGDLGIALRRDPDGTPLYFITSINDITERKQAEEKLRESEARFAAIFNSSPIPISLTDPATDRWLEVNDAFLNLTGYTRADMLGHTYQDLKLWVYPEKREEVRKLLIEDGRAHGFEMEIHKKNGAIVTMLLDVELIAINGKSIILIMGDDITERKRAGEALRESELRFRTLIEQAPVAISVSRNGLGLYANRKFLEITGLQSVEESVGRPIFEYFAPADQAASKERSRRRTLGLPVESEFESIFLRSDGSQFPVQVTVEAVKLSDGLANIGFITDITERKQAENALRDYNERLAAEVQARTLELSQAQEQLVRQERLAVLGQLAGGVGHELRNPLAVINNAVYYLKLVQPEADGKVRQYHGMIEHEVRTAEKIITDLLDFARLQSVDPEPVAVPELVQHVLERFPVPESITTRLDFPATLPGIFVDQRQIEQVLGNLVVNACQAMTATSATTLAQGGHLTISANLNKDLVAIAVKDTGNGIPPENMQRLFEPLFTTKLKGIGLGLAVSKKLAEANGGRIQVQSRPGRGSTFTLFLPVEK